MNINASKYLNKQNLKLGFEYRTLAVVALGHLPILNPLFQTLALSGTDSDLMVIIDRDKVKDFFPKKPHITHSILAIIDLQSKTKSECAQAPVRTNPHCNNIRH